MEHSNADDERPSKRLKTTFPLDTGEEVASEAVAHSVSIEGDAIDQKEQKVGITTFISRSRTVVRGLVKKRYTDFLVNEVLPGGQVLHLKKTKANVVVKQVSENDEFSSHTSNGGTHVNTLEPKSEDQTSTANGQHDEASSGIEQESEVSADDKARLISHLNEKAVSELLSLWDSITKNPRKKSRDHPIVKTDFTTDRTVRAHIHQDVRRIFNSRIESSTTHEGILVLTAAPPRGGPRPSQPRGNRLSWQDRGGEYCHFTLYKENKDTMEAVSMIARFLKTNSKELSFAGTKDRRGATVQRLSARRVDAERLAALNKTLRMMVIGDFEYSPMEIGLGDLEGNEFTITLRECDIDNPSSETYTVSEKVERTRTALSQAMSDLHIHGFVNYFGLQRFGTFAIRSDAVGLKLLSSDFEGACDAILEYNPAAVTSMDEEDGQVGREDRARAEAIKTFHETGRVNESLAIMPKRFSAEANIIRQLGKNPRDFLGAILSIQHGMRTIYVHAYQSMVWNAAASERWRLWGNKIMEGDLVLIREHKNKQLNATVEETIDADGELVVQPSGEDRAQVAEEVFERARPLTRVEAESGLYNVDDIVLPQPGYDVLYPQNASGEFYKTFMGSEAGGGLDPNDMRRKQKDFSLPGAYRKVIAKIGRNSSVDVHTYHKDDQQFVLTDWEKIKMEANASAHKTPTNSTQEDEGEAMRVEKIAAVLKFQLGTSQYATMALRELSGGGVREYRPEFSGGR